MAWPTGGSNGWESFGTPIVTPPISYPLPVLAELYYFDPSRLRGVGTPCESVVLEFSEGLCVVRRRLLISEIEITLAQVWDDALLDAYLLPPIGAPCSLLLEIFEDDRFTPRWSVGTAPDYATPFLIEPTAYAEQEIDAAAGAASVGTISVSIIDPAIVPGDQDGGWLTSRLASFGLADIAGRRARLRRWISEELGWIVLADGPAGSPRLEASYASFSIDIRDTRETERKIRLFEGGGGSSAPGEPFDPQGVKTLLPDSVWGGYGWDGADWLIDPAAPLLGRWSVGSPLCPYDHMALVNLQATPGNAIGLRAISLAAFEAMEGTSVTEGTLVDLGGGDWTRPYRVRFGNLSLIWRLAGSSDPWSEMGSGTLVLDGEESDIGGSASGKYTNLILSSPYGDGREATSIFVGDSRAQGNMPGSAFVPVDGDDIELAVLYRGPPTKELPLYLEGLTAGEVARNVYAGLYSARDEAGAVVSTGIRYDELALLAMTDLVRLRVYETIDDARDWLERAIYAPTGWIPALDDLGQISPVSQVAPLSGFGLLTLSDAIAEPSSDWNAGERIINVIRFIYQRDYRPADPANAETADGLADREIVLEFEDSISVARNGRQILEIKAEAFRAVGQPSSEALGADITTELGYQLGLLRQMHVQNRYSFGAPTISVAVMREPTTGLRAGSWVVVDLSWLPDYVTTRRGLVGLAQVTALGDLDCKWRRVLMEIVVPLAVAGS